MKVTYTSGRYWLSWYRVSILYFLLTWVQNYLDRTSVNFQDTCTVLLSLILWCSCSYQLPTPKDIFHRQRISVSLHCSSHQTQKFSQFHNRLPHRWVDKNGNGHFLVWKPLPETARFCHHHHYSLLKPECKEMKGILLSFFKHSISKQTKKT